MKEARTVIETARAEAPDPSERGAPVSVPKIPHLAVHAASGERTMLYRFYDEPGDLLYVGITDDPHIRWAAHARNRDNLWWERVRVVHTEWYPTRTEAEGAEVAAIQREKPQYNVSHVLVPRRDRRLVSRYLHPMTREQFGDEAFTYRDLADRLCIPYGTVVVYGRRLVASGGFREVGTQAQASGRGGQSRLFMAVEQAAVE